MKFVLIITIIARNEAILKLLHKMLSVSYTHLDVYKRQVELVQVTHPEKSYETLEDMSTYVQSLLQKLGLHYRVLSL